MAAISLVTASPPIGGLTQPVANWGAGRRSISVFQENNKLKYSISSDSNREIGNISLGLYNTPELKQLALEFIAIFKCALLGSRRSEHRFLPVFWAWHERPNQAEKVLIALFARVNVTGDSGKEVVEAKWGMQVLGRVTWLTAEDRETREFLIGAPAYRDEMDIYCHHFKEVVTSDADNRIQSIVLRCVSGFNQDLFLDQNTWAITPVSVQKRRGIAGLLGVGHGCIAWEGIEAGSYFLKWAELTSDYPNPESGFARIRIGNRKIPSKNWRAGPTISRTKELINQMVAHISRDLTVLDGVTWSSRIRFSFFAPLKNLFKSSLQRERERRALGSLESCISFVVSAAQRAKIFLPEPGGGINEDIEPNASKEKALSKRQGL